MPGQREHLLGDDGAAQQRAELQPQHGEQRDRARCGSAWRSTTARSDRPLARASARSPRAARPASHARVIRERKAASAVPSVTAGSTRWRNESAPDTGSQSSRSAKRRSASAPARSAAAARARHRPAHGAASTAPPPPRRGRRAPAGKATPRANSMAAQSEHRAVLRQGRADLAASTFCWKGGSEVRRLARGEVGREAQAARARAGPGPSRARSAARGPPRSLVPPGMTSTGCPGTRLRKLETRRKAPARERQPRAETGASR